MANLKIAILVGGLPPLYNGGTEIATTKIAEYAAKAGHDVHIIAADGSGKGEALYKELERGFKVHRVKTIPPHYWHGLSYIPSSVKTLISLKPDVVHAQALYIAPSALIVNRIVGIPYMLYERGGVSLNGFWNKPIYTILMRYAKRAIAQTQHQKKALLEYADRDIEVIPNGVDADRFGKMSKAMARNMLGFPADRRIVLSVGRCRLEKNLKNFVKAAKLGRDNAIYVLIGDGDQLEDLKRLADGHVVFTGGVDNSEIPVYMSAADILVNTSLSEGFPVAVLEAMSSGLPVVAPRICGLPEIVTDGINGLLTMPDDYKSTAEAIERILNDKQLAIKMSSENRNKARQYTWESVIEKLYG